MATISWSGQFGRQNRLPLDVTYVFDDNTALQTYLTSGPAYAGQVVAVLNGTNPADVFVLSVNAGVYSSTKLATTAGGGIQDVTQAGNFLRSQVGWVNVNTVLPGNFAGSTPGLVPTSSGGTTNYLRADGQWQAPPQGGGGPAQGITLGHDPLTPMPANPQPGDVVSTTCGELFVAKAGGNWVQVR